MIPDIYDELLNNLIRRTIKGDVYWRLSPQGDKFTVRFNEFSLSITRGLDYIHFTIMDANDKKIDEFRVLNTNKEWDRISAFYNQIRIKSPSINNAIKAIIEELEREGVIGLQDADSYSEVNKKIYKIAG